jgi:hypothetical protein
VIEKKVCNCDCLKEWAEVSQESPAAAAAVSYDTIPAFLFPLLLASVTAAAAGTSESHAAANVPVTISFTCHGHHHDAHRVHSATRV